MRNVFLWIAFYALVLALSQILLKIGLNQIGAFQISNLVHIVTLVLKNPYVLGGTLLLGSSFFIWLFILSWFKLGVVFPLTAVTYILVALLAYFILDEKLSWYNYLGILLISGGIFFLLYK